MSLASAQATAEEAPAPQPPPSQPPASSSGTTAEPPLADLYGSILPSPLGEEAESTEPNETAAPSSAEDGQLGLRFNRISIVPRFDALYVNADSALESAQPVRDRYLELRPAVTAEAALGSGEVRASYGAFFRRQSSFAIVNSTVTHLGDLSLRTELGSIAELDGVFHYSRGLLETAEVDPGREYFFDLGRYSRRMFGARVRLNPGGRGDLALAGSHDAVEVDEGSQFFDHDQDTLSVTGGYELGPVVRTTVGYTYSRIPFTIDRPEVESSTHSALLGLQGEILPLTTADVTVGYTSRTSPRAAPGGTHYSGLIAGGRIEKSFTPSTSLTLSGGRSTYESAFEENGFYVATAVTLVLRAALPASLSLQTGIGQHRNRYLTVSALANTPRMDVIRGWTVGLGRPLWRRAFVRADYRWESRDSNLEAFDSHSSGLTVQLGLNAFDGSRP
jgi:putative beta-barrel porin BBP2